MNKKKHLTNAERIKIETLLSQGFSIRSIADFLEKSPSTISREMHKHSLIKREYCFLEKHFYDTKKAQLGYCDALVQSRDGFELTLYDITSINNIVSPRIKKDSRFTI